MAAGNYTIHDNNLHLFPVVSPPSISSSPESAVQITSPAGLNLSCSASGYPLPNITWIRTLQDGSEMTLSKNNNTENEGEQTHNIIDDVIVRSTFSISSAGLQDTAHYTCIAVNTHGNDSADSTVNVYRKLKIIFLLNKTIIKWNKNECIGYITWL